MLMTEGMFSSKSDEWATPQKLFDTLNDEFHFTLDPCASIENHKCQTYFTMDDNGLMQDWGNHIVFMNPPYGKAIGNWVKKARQHGDRGGGVRCTAPLQNRYKMVD